MDPILERYQALEQKILDYNPGLDRGRLFSAFTYGLGDIYLLPYRGLSTILYLGIVDPNQFQSQEVTPHV